MEVFMLALYQPIAFFDLEFAFSWMDLILTLVVPLGIYLVLGVLASHWVRSYLVKSTAGEERAQKIFRAYRLAYRLILVLLVGALSTRFLDSTVIKFLEDLGSILTRPLLNSGVSIFTLLLSLPLIYGSILLGRAVRIAFDRSKFIAASIADQKRAMLATFLRWGVTILALLAGLSIIGINLSSVGFFMGIVGFAIAIGMWQVLSAFFAGIVLTLNRSVREGDWIGFHAKSGPIEGLVRQTRLLSIEVEGSSGEIIEVPSTDVVFGQVRHRGHEVQSRPLALRMDFSLEASPELIEKVLLKATTSVCSGEGLPETRVNFLSLGRGCIETELVAHIALDAPVVGMRSRLVRAIWEGARAEGLAWAQSQPVPITRKH